MRSKSRSFAINKKEKRKIDSNIDAIQKAVSSLKGSKRILKNVSNRRESQKISMNILDGPEDGIKFLKIF